MSRVTLLPTKNINNFQVFLLSLQCLYCYNDGCISSVVLDQEASMIGDIMIQAS